MLLTYQDFLESNGNIPEFISRAIAQYKHSDEYKVACEADLYNAQRNVTINNYVKTIFNLSGNKVVDFTATNNKIASNFFNRLNTQRNTYSLGNGISFAKNGVKEKFGKQFDTVLQSGGFHALIHGVSYLYMLDRVYEFSATEFVPIWDEYDGGLKMGIRWWKLDTNKPLIAVLYEPDGVTKFRQDADSERLLEIEAKHGYIQKFQYAPAIGTELIGEENYSALPIVPLWGSSKKQSTLVGMKQAIDSYDLIRSGFANDLTDCSQIYWIIENFGGMNEDDLKRFREKLLLNHIAEVNTADGGRVNPYTQEIPYNARQAYLEHIRAGIYEDFGGLDVHTIAAGATNDHIDAAYQPMDENADDFEKQIIECVQKLGALLGIDEDDCVPLFKRNRISNQLEQVQMLVQEAEWLDEQTILEKLPNVTVDEIEKILKRKDEEDMDRMARNPFANQAQEEKGANEATNTTDDAANIIGLG